MTVRPTWSERGGTSARVSRSRAIAIGDLHGDLKAALDVLRLAGVTDEFNNWSGYVDILVQTGDIIDRYVPENERNAYKVIKERQHLLTKDWFGQAWKNHYKSAVRLPLHPSVGDTSGSTRYSPVTSSSGALSHSAIPFVHGGLSLTFRCLLPFPTHINSLSDALLKRAFNPDPHPTRSFSTSDECQLTADDGPLWYRDWAMNNDKEVCAKIDEALKKTETRRMVRGHTIQEEITARCDGKISLIDTGELQYLDVVQSSAYNDGETGLLSALSIYHTLSPIERSANPKVQGWEEREVISAIYPDEEEITMINEKREVAGDFSIS
ncbi:hypothetical protein DFS33DRAFT_1373468 [Desarmillaria ectypa]|nr:hypothetical protein DFS33DRAFT_1373468 [Desarmillaria ectypa]